MSSRMMAAVWAAAVMCGAVSVAHGQANGEATRVIQTMPTAELMRRPPPQPIVRTPPWHNVEHDLKKLAKQRQEWNQGYADVHLFYNRLASPASSGSQTLEQHIKVLKRWQEEIPKSAAARVVMAKALFDHAWEARGGGYAATVTDEGWKLFRERVVAARHQLDDAIELGVTDGEAYACLVKLGYAEGFPRERVQHWVETGMKLDPTYFEIYDEMAIYLMPRWMGEEGEIEEFATWLTRKIPGDDGLDAFARVALQIQHYECGWGDTLTRGAYDKELLVRSAEVLLKRYPNNHQAGHFAALCALVAQDHAAAQRIRPFVGPFKQEDKIWVWENDVVHFRNWAAAAEDPRGEESWVFAGMTGCPGIAFGKEKGQMWVAQQFGKAALNLMDVRTNQIEGGLPHPGGIVRDFVVDPVRQWMVISSFQGPLTGWQLWDLSRVPVPYVHPTEKPCGPIAIHPTRPLVFWTEGKEVKSWDIQADAAGPTIEAAGEIVFSPDGKLVAVNHAVYELENGKLPLIEPNKAPRYIIHKILALEDDGRAWAMAFEAKHNGHKNSLVRFAADGKTSETLLEEVGEGLAWLSPDRKLLARVPTIAFGAAVTPIDIWNIERKKLVKRFPGHWNSIKEVAFSPDGSKLASVGIWADRVKIWPLDGLAD